MSDIRALGRIDKLCPAPKANFYSNQARFHLTEGLESKLSGKTLSERLPKTF
jgi:hypothetical protein